MVIPTIPAWLKYRQINTENLEKAKAVGTPISEPKQEHITKPAGISTVNPMVPGEAPGQPPRPGLEWNPGTHRWVSSNRGMGGFGGDEGEGGGYPIQEDTEAEQLVKDFNDKLKAEFARGDSEDHWCHAYVFSEFLKHHKVNANSLARGSEAIIQMIDEEGNSTFIDPINDNFEPTEDVTTLVSDAIGIYKYGWITLKESVKDEELLKRTDQLVTDIVGGSAIPEEDISKEWVEKTRGVPKQAGPPPGPPPTQGLEWNPQTHRWFRPDNPESEQQEHVDLGNISEIFKERGHMTPAQKKKVKEELIGRFDGTPFFKALATGLAFYTQGFFDPIRNVSAAIVSGTIPEFEANSTGYLRDGIMEGKEDPLMVIAAFARVIDIFGNDTEAESKEAKGDLGVMTYGQAKMYSSALLESLAQVPATDRPLYRGVQISNREPPKFVPGETFYVPGLTSFTRDEGIGKSFAWGVARGQSKTHKEAVRGERARHGGYIPPRKKPLLIKVIGENKALDIDTFSTWPQQEAITNGEFEIVSYEEGKDEYPGQNALNTLTLKQKKLGTKDWPKGKGVEYRLPVEIAKDLTPDEYYAVIEIKSQIDDHIKYPISNAEYAYGWMPSGLSTLVAEKKINQEKLENALKKLGYRIGEGDQRGTIYYDYPK
jgi:hypothetical protein